MRSIVSRTWAGLRRHWCSSAVLALLVVTAAGATVYQGWTSAQLQAARDQLAKEEFAAARASLETYLWLRPWDVSSYLLAGRLERLAGHWDRAEAYLNEVLRRQGGASEALQLEWLLLRSQRGEIDKLAPGLRQCLDSGHPESAAILNAMSLAYLSEARLQSALSCLDQWLAREPTAIAAHTRRGWVLEQLEQFDAAAHEYEQALELYPHHFQARLKLANLHLNGVNAGRARPHIDYLRQHWPRRPEVLFAAARCCYLEGQLTQARQLYDEGLALEPDNATALLQRGKLELQENDPGAAERLLRRALQRQPNDLAIHYALYRSLLLQGHETEAARHKQRHDEIQKDLNTLNQLLRYSSDEQLRQPATATEVGRLLLRLGQEQMGLRWLHSVLASDSGFAPARAALAEYHTRQQSSAPAPAAIPATAEAARR